MIDLLLIFQGCIWLDKRSCNEIMIRKIKVMEFAMTASES